MKKKVVTITLATLIATSSQVFASEINTTEESNSRLSSEVINLSTTTTSDSLLIDTPSTADPISITDVSNLKIIDVELAKKATKMYIEETAFSGVWDGADLELADTLYDIDDSILGYYFKIMKNGEYLGYVITSATNERAPILQYGDGKLDVAKNQDGRKLYYLGIHGIVSSYDKHELKKIVQDLVTENKKARSMENVELKSVKKLNDGVKRWNKLLGGKENTFTAYATSYPSSMKLSVTPLNQYSDGVNGQNSACGPTTGAMIANYLNYPLGYNVKNAGSYDNSNVKLINHMRDDMNTDFTGTVATYFAQGLGKHLNHNYSTTKFDVLTADGSGNLGLVKTRIGVHKLPLGLMFDMFPESGRERPDLKWHWVCLNAYTSEDIGFTNTNGETSVTYINYAQFDQDIVLAYIMVK